jgi:hypothetical protein
MTHREDVHHALTHRLTEMHGPKPWTVPEMVDALLPTVIRCIHRELWEAADEAWDSRDREALEDRARDLGEA